MVCAWSAVFFVRIVNMFTSPHLCDFLDPAAKAPLSTALWISLQISLGVMRPTNLTFETSRARFQLHQPKRVAWRVRHCKGDYKTETGRHKDKIDPLGLVFVNFCQGPCLIVLTMRWKGQDHCNSIAFLRLFSLIFLPHQAMSSRLCYVPNQMNHLFC